MKTKTIKLILAAFAATAICFGAKAKTVDLSTLTANYTAEDGDVLTGATIYGIIIPDGATVTLSDATIACSVDPSGIWCAGNATIILDDGTTNTVSQSKNYCGTIRIGESGTTLTIKGNTGKLVAYAQYWYGAIGSYSYNGGDIVIEGGILEVSGPKGCFGWGYSGTCNSVTIKGGTVTATGNTYAINCTTFNVESTITRVALHGDAAAINASNVNISSKLARDETDGGKNITLEPSLNLDGEGTENDPYVLTDKDDLLMALVKGDPNPMYVQFTEGLAIEGPITIPASMNALTVDLNGGSITGTTGLPAVILAGDTAFTATGMGTISADEEIEAVKRQGSVTASSGVTITGIGGGGSVPEPEFPAKGASEVVKFAQAEGGKWTITAFAELDNESRGTDVTDDMIKIYSADTIEALEAETEPMAEGVEIEERRSTVKTVISVAPSESATGGKFFKVKFGE